MSRKTENTGFICIHCVANVLPLTNGSYRNHCPCCLYSLHIDYSPGDRENDCNGLMKPIGFHNHSKKGWQIIHRCQKYGLAHLKEFCSPATHSSQSATSLFFLAHRKLTLHFEFAQPQPCPCFLWLSVLQAVKHHPFRE